MVTRGRTAAGPVRAVGGVSAALSQSVQGTLPIQGGSRKRRVSDTGGVIVPRTAWRLVVVVTLLGAAAGAVFGFVRGLAYLPTLPFAIVEGGILSGVPAAGLGLLAMGLREIWGTPSGAAAAGSARRDDKAALRFACISVQLVSAALIIAAAETLPWANYRVRDNPSTPVDAGTFIVSLVAIGAAAAVMAALQFRWRAVALAGAELVAGVGGLVVVVVTAADRIAHANSITLGQGGSTAFAGGSGLAIFASLALVSSAVTVLVLDSPRSRRDEWSQPVMIGPQADDPLDL